ncbi:hypothetical protein PROFUN_13946 [Planoprotostelium fungivorum]|uniref:CHCH domain-containing protein n=1 Tax=Planoprotostelium fungivorum TaxID=1890364 RepID=A0A2P6N2F9_9EUKA|nr:hypothetical protein PROFUN_13946 [Planoprotostelium fungivorum]
MMLKLRGKVKLTRNKMARGSSRSGGSPGVHSVRSAPRTASAPPSSSYSAPKAQAHRPAAVTPAAPASSASKPTTPVAPQTAMGQPMAGGAPAQGGMMRNIASNAAGSMIGYMAANSLMGAFRGDGEPAANGAAAGAAATPMAPGEDLSRGPCAIQYQSFLKCIEANPGNISNCQWAEDMFQSCRINNNGSQL